MHCKWIAVSIDYSTLHWCCLANLSLIFLNCSFNWTIQSWIFFECMYICHARIRYNSISTMLTVTVCWLTLTFRFILLFAEKQWRSLCWLLRMISKDLTNIFTKKKPNEKVNKNSYNCLCISYLWSFSIKWKICVILKKLCKLWRRPTFLT